MLTMYKTLVTEWLMFKIFNNFSAFFRRPVRRHRPYRHLPAMLMPYPGLQMSGVRSQIGKNKFAAAVIVVLIVS